MCWVLSLLVGCGAQAQAPIEPSAQRSRPHPEVENRSRVGHEPIPRPSHRSENPTHEATPKEGTPKPSVNKVLVTRVVDGDTIEVDYRGSIVDIRFIGVDITLYHRVLNGRNSEA